MGTKKPAQKTVKDQLAEMRAWKQRKEVLAERAKAEKDPDMKDALFTASGIAYERARLAMEMAAHQLVNAEEKTVERLIEHK